MSVRSLNGGAGLFTGSAKASFSLVGGVWLTRLVTVTFLTKSGSTIWLDFCFILWVSSSFEFDKGDEDFLSKFVLAPYFAWRSTHHSHHKATVSIERDENYVPRTRSDFKLPSESVARAVDYHELFEETPIYTVARMLLMQLLGWQIYLCLDTMGSPRHPKGTNVRSTVFVQHML